MSLGRRQVAFLRAVAGERGADALLKAAAESPQLAWAVLPRVLTAWVDVVAMGGYEGVVPGTQEQIVLKKSEAGLSGTVSIGGNLHDFVNASTQRVAAHVALSIGGALEAPVDMSSPYLARLGKSVDLLVKARLLADLHKAQTHGAGRGSLPGSAASALAPEAPLAPTPTAPKPEAAAADATKPAKPLPKLPGAKAPRMRVSKTEAALGCPDCGHRQFAGDRFTGCSCFKSLAKSVSVKVNPTGYQLEFGGSWDVSDVLKLAEALGK